jgi:hypothetical protein
VHLCAHLLRQPARCAAQPQRAARTRARAGSGSQRAARQGTSRAPCRRGPRGAPPSRRAAGAGPGEGPRPAQRVRVGKGVCVCVGGGGMSVMIWLRDGEISRGSRGVCTAPQCILTLNTSPLKGTSV